MLIFVCTGPRLRLHKMRYRSHKRKNGKKAVEVQSVLDARREKSHKTVAAVTTEYGVHPNQRGTGKKQ